MFDKLKENFKNFKNDIKENAKNFKNYNQMQKKDFENRECKIKCVSKK